MKNIRWPYDEYLSDINALPSEFNLGDHLDGFDKNLNNVWLDKINNFGIDNNRNYTAYVDQFYDDRVKQKFSNITLKYSYDMFGQYIPWPKFLEYDTHPFVNFENFVSSFNGIDHVSRQLLTSALNKFGWFNAEYSSKNFTCDSNKIDDHLEYFCPTKSGFYRKFFISDKNDKFFETVYSFGHNRFSHVENIKHLEDRLTKSFVHLISETMATSYYPFVTEKFLYGVVTRGLFLAYAQPGWHDHLEKYYGFQKYQVLFDYKFDTITNPIERLIELLSMLAKYSNLSKLDWHDLYQLESQTIEYNYDHFFSGHYRETARKWSELF
jgi:hypothetical protein